MRHRDFYHISLHPEDAAAAGLCDGDLAALHNRGQRVRGLVHLDPGLTPGQVFSPIHWSAEFSGEACISALVPAITDPLSGQPQSKFAPVELEALSVGCWGMLFSRDKISMPSLQYWSRIPVPGGYLCLLASGADIDAVDQLRESLLQLLVNPRLSVAQYSDAAQADYRRGGMLEGELRYAIFLHGDRRALPSRDWLAGLGQQSTEATSPTGLLAGLSLSQQDVGRMVCSCWEVGEKQITAAIQAGAGNVDMLGTQLRCGTQCGSCIPELRQLLNPPAKNCAA